MHDVPRRLHLAAGPLLAAACGGGGTTPGGTTGVNQRLEGRGAQLFAQSNCHSCYSTSGQRLAGPPLNGLYGRQVTLEGGQRITADEAHLWESILEPDAKIVQGYPQGVMAGALADKMNQIRQSDHVAALVAYIKGFK